MNKIIGLEGFYYYCLLETTWIILMLEKDMSLSNINLVCWTIVHFFMMMFYNPLHNGQETPHIPCLKFLDVCMFIWGLIMYLMHPMHTLLLIWIISKIISFVMEIMIRIHHNKNKNNDNEENIITRNDFLNK